MILDDAYRAASRWFLGRPKPFTPVGGELEPCPSPLRWGRIPLAPESRVLAPWRQTAGHLLQALGLRADHRDHFQDALRRIVRAAVSVGSCSPVARRLPLLEQALVGRPCDAALGNAVTDAHMAPLAPLDDARGSADYRLDAARTLTARTLAELGSSM